MVGCQCDVKLWEGVGELDGVPGINPILNSTNH